uniref:Uncharacterized protein n=1 Tax=Triticum urartu TaxID=4572 RepID=A0A8R7Q5A8_TRIUA
MLAAPSKVGLGVSRWVMSGAVVLVRGGASATFAWSGALGFRPWEALSNPRPRCCVDQDGLLVQCAVAGYESQAAERCRPRVKPAGCFRWDALGWGREVKEDVVHIRSSCGAYICVPRCFLQSHKICSNSYWVFFIHDKIAEYTSGQFYIVHMYLLYSTDDRVFFYFCSSIVDS